MPHDGSTRLVQLSHPDQGRRVALVYHDELHLLATYRSAYSFAVAALETGWKLRDLFSTDLSGIVLDYREVHALRTPWRFLPAFDDPVQPGRCLVSAVPAGGGWQYAGSGDCLRAHGDGVEIAPAPMRFPEIAAAYLMDFDSVPRRVGVALGAGMAIGPELILETGMPRLEGSVAVLRGGKEVRRLGFCGGDVPLALALAAVEPDHFRHAGHRRAGDSHVHFFGARLFDPVKCPDLKEGDELVVELAGFGQRLCNRLTAAASPEWRSAAVPL